MKLILKETIESLGIIGSEVSVAAGYARNYLLPQGKAVAATDANRKQLAQQKAKFDLQIAKEKGLAQEMAKQLEGVTCTIAAKVSDGDQLYGSITTRDIINALSKQEVTIEKRMILLREPIKMLGTFKVPIRVYNGVEPEISIEVIAE
jgi:large subunit ribosomal protein L9